MKSKRKIFLEAYFKIFEMEKIEWIEKTEKSIRGIVIYDSSDFAEKQEFIWHKSENEVPSENVRLLIEKLITEKLMVGDKLVKPTKEIEFGGFSETQKEKLFEELFDIGINMIDNGKETDIFYIHN
jgi:hypothetical protein